MCTLMYAHLCVMGMFPAALPDGVADLQLRTALRYMILGSDVDSGMGCSCACVAEGIGRVPSRVEACGGMWRRVKAREGEGGRPHFYARLPS